MCVGEGLREKVSATDGEGEGGGKEERQARGWASTRATGARALRGVAEGRVARASARVGRCARILARRTAAGGSPLRSADAGDSGVQPGVISCFDIEMVVWSWLVCMDQWPSKILGFGPCCRFTYCLF